MFAYNNLWANCRAIRIHLPEIHDYNAFYDNWRTDITPPEDINLKVVEDHMQVMTEDPFVSSANQDFHLKTFTDPGMVLPAPYDTDFDGKIRGRFGTWDRGAHAYTFGLSDAISVLKIMVNDKPSIMYAPFDINKNGYVGMEDAEFILQLVSGLR